MADLNEAAVRQGLPAHLRERARLLPARPRAALQGDAGAAQKFVLYWMRSALRGHENPALDAAIWAGNAWKLPVLVLLHVEDDYPHATARRQMFLLQGAQAAQAELRRRGVQTAVQVDRTAGGRGACLGGASRYAPVLELARSAALVVAEEPFCVPWLAGVEALQEGGLSAPTWLLDCCSVVPCALVSPGVCHRAYAFENGTKELHRARISWVWEDVRADAVVDGGAAAAEVAARAAADAAAALEPVDLLAEPLLRRGDDGLRELVQAMRVDHSVKELQHTRGGSEHGYQRWHDWIAMGGLKTYASRRNEALDVSGVSRMSAYLNAGMVSPMRIAREANATPGSGKSKFLNEYLTWRGVSYAWCFHFPMPASGCTLDQLPRWASETLRQHAADPRPGVKSRQALAEARSGDAGWDGMQRYLRETGELHNNSRMGWGCALVKWTASPEDALRALLDLNNTFALDGHAPPSYGGLLGCLGLFAGPKGDVPISGKVSLRFPKPKYAAMPGKIAELLADRPSLPAAIGGACQGLGRFGFAPSAKGSYYPPTSAPAETQVVGQPHRKVFAVIDLDADSDAADAPPVASGACSRPLEPADKGASGGSPPKRGKRWQRVGERSVMCS